MNSNKDNHPHLVKIILGLFLDGDDYYQAIGDFEETYRYQVKTKGLAKANLWFWFMFFKSLPGFISNSIYWRGVMFLNYLKIALRNIKRHKGYSFINIAGLAIGLACCILIFLWVWDELSYDRFHEHIHELCRVVRSERSQDGTISRFAGTPRPLGPSFKEAYPEIIEFARFHPYKSERVLLEYKDNKFYEDGFSFADPSFFAVFTFPFIQGDPKTALSEPYAVVITEQTAEKYFGSKDAIGRTLTMKNWGDFTVSGIIKNIPANSHIQFDFISPIGILFERFSWMRGWRMPHFYTYVLLEKISNIHNLNAKIRDHIKGIDPELFKIATLHFALQPVEDIHLRSNYKFDLSGHSEIKSVYVTFFSAIAVFVLIIACINFMNLATARSANRAREIGIRKVSGANRSDIAKQFFGESLLMSLISLGIAIILVALSLPVFNALTGKQLNFTLFSNMNILLGILGIAVITGCLSGLYPSMLLSSFQPASVLKGTLASGSKGFLFRRILVITQFTLSLILIIGTVIIYRQLDYMQSMKLGYDKDYLLYFAKQGGLRGQYDAFKSTLLKNPYILGVTTSSDVPTHTRHLTIIEDWEGKSPEDRILMNYFSVDHDFIETFGIEMVAGRNFSKDFSTDTNEGYVVNEEAVKQMGIKSPIGKRFSLWNYKGHIIGVMKNFHFKSLHDIIEPLIFRIQPQWDRYIFVRVRSAGIADTLKSLESVHHQFNPEYPFEFKFLDEEIEQLYQVEKRMMQTFQSFTGLAIFISCIGLFGLAAFMAEQRTKEIGIRKVLGASVPGVVMLLCKDFTKWILIANVIGWPLAFVVMKMWLQNFSYRIGPGIWQFLMPGIVMLCIALLTVSYHSLKAALANPVDSLRYD